MTTRADKKKAARLKAYLGQMLRTEQFEKMCEIVDKVLLNEDRKDEGNE